MPQPPDEPAHDRPARPRPQVWAVLSILGALAFTALWVAAVVTLFDESTFMTEGMGGGWMLHAAFFLVGGWFGWRWWLELLHPDVHRERPPEPEEPTAPHRGLSGEEQPPQRW